jgi:UDP-N-acetylmuramate dehydrogenase
MHIQENIPLKNLTTFRIGGPARFFCVATTVEELQQAITFAKKNNLAIFPLGGGSNILVSDSGFSGLVIKIEIKGIQKTEEKNNAENIVEVIAGAGEDWDALVAYAVENNLHGIENLSLIPGTVGAAPVQNIGAYGMEAKDAIQNVEVVDLETGEVKNMSNAECLFSYRDSIFKKPEGKKYIITRVAFNLTTTGELITSYKDIAEYIKNNNLKPEEVTLKKIRDIVIDVRTKKLPDVKHIGTAGSFFKNPVISKSEFNNLKLKYPELPGRDAGDSIKISAAWVLDNVCGFKGYKEGNVGVYKNQALVLVNFGNATSQEIKTLAEKMIESVKEKTGITLVPEVQVIS